jgi:hypothetical protein
MDGTLAFPPQQCALSDGRTGPSLDEKVACDFYWQGVYHGNTHPHVIAPTSPLLTRRKNRKTKSVLHLESVGEYGSEAWKATYRGLEITPAEVLSVFFSASAISPVAPIDVSPPATNANQSGEVRRTYRVVWVLIPREHGCCSGRKNCLCSR